MFVGSLLPGWPILLVAGILITAFLLYCVLRFGEDARRRHVVWCPSCRVCCDEVEPCLCCREAR